MPSRPYQISLWLIAALATCFFSCGDEDSRSQNDTPVARVGDEYLYLSDLNGIVKSATSIEDSAQMAERYIDVWVSRKLLLDKAMQEMEVDQDELSRRVEEYKFQLVIYDYEKLYIQENLDTAITDTEVEAYYLANSDNFVLKKNIIQGIYLKIPNEAPQTSRLRQWFARWNDENKANVKDYALQFADDIQVEDSTWVPVDDVVANTPFRSRIETNPGLLRPDNLLVSQDTAFLYFLRINNFKLSDEVSPISFVRNQIKDIILNRRKLELTRKNENKILEEAKKKNKYEVFE